MDAIYETFKKTKDNKNDKYGVKNSGNTGKNFYNRSFGGGMSNRKYTKEQVKPHKLKKSIGVISSDIKNKTIIPPLYPVSNASSQKGYRTGYLNNDLNDIPRTSDLTTYYQPMQNLEDVKLKKLKDNNNTKIKITNINNDKNANINNDKNIDVQGGNGYDGGYNGYNDGYNGINNGYNWYYGGYGAPNWYNPYYFGSYLPWMPPYQDEQQPIIINNIPDKQNMTPHMPLTHRMDLICLVIVVILIVLLFVKN